MKPLHYTLHLEPDLDNFTFDGRVTIRFETADPASAVSLNSLELSVRECAVRQDGQWVSCAFLMNPEKETLEIRLPKALAGRFEVRVDYTGRINDKLAGFYRSAYTVGDQVRHVAVTQFQESDARRALPCLDHPQYKAVFAVEIITEPGLAVISNEAIAEETRLDNGKKAVRFHETPKMSTYLLFFGVGEFETETDQKDRRVTGCALAGRSDQLAFGVAFGRKALQFSETYYGIPYPLRKMDLIAIPDFAFGAMENWGAITFRENLLLYDPKTTSRAGMQRICEVTAHEIAHQWFGNLVTPADWKYLWLNESFATYFGYGVVDHYYPEWNTWGQFLLNETESAMARDGLHETFPIEIPGGEHVVINSSTAPIIYSKGGSLLRQIEGYIGPDHFQQGLQRYLKTHQYDCASSHHLWEAFEAAARRPVTEMVQRWVEQPGFPLVEARREDRRLVLSQKRFTYRPLPSEACWPIPLVLDAYTENGKCRRQVLLLEDREKTVALDADITAVKLNAGQTGFYRTHYQNPADLTALGRLAARQLLAPEDRWGLQNDLFALVRAGVRPLEDYLTFLAFYDAETSDLPLISIDANLFSAYLVIDRAAGEAVAQKGRAIARRTLDRIGFRPVPDEGQTTSMLREQMIWHAAVFGEKTVLDFAGRQFEALTRGGPVDPNLSKSVLQVAALTRGQSAFDWFCSSLATTGSEHERMNLLAALGCLRDAPLVEKAARYTLDKVPDRNKFIPLVAMAANPHAVPLLWDWYTAHVKALETMHPLLYERVVGAVIPVAGMQSPDAVRVFFRDYLQKTSLAADAIRLSLEKLEINLAMREA